MLNDLDDTLARTKDLGETPISTSFGKSRSHVPTGSGCSAYRVPEIHRAADGSWWSARLTLFHLHEAADVSFRGGGQSVWGGDCGGEAKEAQGCDGGENHCGGGCVTCEIRIWRVWM